MNASTMLISGPFLGIFVGAQVMQGREHGLGDGRFSPQRRLPAQLARHDLVVRQPIRDSAGALFLGGIPVAEFQQRRSEVRDRDGQGVSRRSGAGTGWPGGRLRHRPRDR